MPRTKIAMKAIEERRRRPDEVPAGQRRPTADAAVEPAMKALLLDLKSLKRSEDWVNEEVIRLNKAVIENAENARAFKHDPAKYEGSEREQIQIRLNYEQTQIEELEHYEGMAKRFAEKVRKKTQEVQEEARATDPKPHHGAGAGGSHH